MYADNYIVVKWFLGEPSTVVSFLLLITELLEWWSVHNSLVLLNVDSLRWVIVVVAYTMNFSCCSYRFDTVSVINCCCTVNVDIWIVFPFNSVILMFKCTCLSVWSLVTYLLHSLSNDVRRQWRHISTKAKYIPKPSENNQSPLFQ